MNVTNKTCLFCLKPRQILVDDSSTAKAIQKIYNIKLPSDGCRICIECHFNIGRIFEFKRTIEAAADFDVDSCFVCKSENTVCAPGVDRVVNYLLKQCTTIAFGKTDTVRACMTCLYLLEISIKYEKLAKNYASAKRFCKQFTTIKECNVALWKINLDALGDICEGIDDSGGGGKGGGGGPGPSGGKEKKSRKRERGSWGPREETASKRSKQEDGSVLPVMLTKLTPTTAPMRPGGKKSLSPNSNSITPKAKGSKPSEKFFIKLPIPKKLHWKKLNQHRAKFGTPHSPSRRIPASPSVDDLNKIFSVDLRPLYIRIEHVDLSTYLNRTIAHDSDTRQLRKPRNEEFIGLDEEDVVELQQNNTSISSSVGKRKSILVTERIESPNSAKKKVKFSDSPSIKYVDKLEFSDDENGEKEDDEDEKDSDFETKKEKKKSPKPHNGTPPLAENGKARRPRKPKKVDNGKDEDEEEEDPDVEDTDKREKNDAGQKNAAKDEKESNEKKDKEMNDVETKCDENEEKDEDKRKKPNREKSDDEEKTAETSPENGNVDEKVDEPAKKTTETSPEEQPESKPQSHDEDTTTPMDAEDSEEPCIDAPMKAVENADILDAEMKDASASNSPQDVEMADSKSPEDVEMQDVDKATVNGEQDIPEDKPPSESNEKPDMMKEPSTDFESSDKAEEEIEQVKLSLSSLLGDEISDSEQETAELDNRTSSENEASKSEPEDKHDAPDAPQSDKPQEQQVKLNSLLGDEISDSEQEKSETENRKSSEDEASKSVPDDKHDTEPEAEPQPQSDSVDKVKESKSPDKNKSFSSLDDVDDISDDDDILNQLEDVDGNRKRSPDLPPLGEDSL